MIQGKKKVTGVKQKARRQEAIQKKAEEIQILHLKTYKFSTTVINLKGEKKRVVFKANMKTIFKGFF